MYLIFLEVKSIKETVNPDGIAWILLLSVSLRHVKMGRFAKELSDSKNFSLWHKGTPECKNVLTPAPTHAVRSSLTPPVVRSDPTAFARRAAASALEIAVSLVQSSSGSRASCVLITRRSACRC